MAPRSASSGIPITGIEGGSARHMAGAGGGIAASPLAIVVAIVAVAAIVAFAVFGVRSCASEGGQQVSSEAAQSAQPESSASASTESASAQSGFSVAVGGLPSAIASSTSWNGISGITGPSDWKAAGFDPHDVLNVAADGALTYFDLREKHQAPVAAGAMPKVRDAISVIEEDDATCGFAVIELDSGRGVAYNPGQSTYSASCIKGPVVFYFLAEASQKGEDVYGDDYIEYRDTLLYSDNDSYIELVDTHDSQACHAWLAEHGITFPTDEDTSGFITDYFTYVSAASLASTWGEMSATLGTADADLSLFWDDVANTEVSFIRDGLAGTGAKVWNKAGWIGDDDLNSVDDAGIVEANGKRYVFAIATSEPAGDAEANVVNLVEALGDAFAIADTPSSASSAPVGDASAASVSEASEEAAKPSSSADRE